MTLEWPSLPPRQTPVEVVRLFPKICVRCGREFIATHRSYRTCGEVCRKEHKAAYYRDYHVAHRKQRNARALERAKLRDKVHVAAIQLKYRTNSAHVIRTAYAWGLTIKETRRHLKNGTEPLRRRRRIRRNGLIEKVAREWQVPWREARRMVMAGTFPP